MKLLADLEVTTKAVERTAEATGEDIAVRQQEEIQRALQFDLPMIVGEPVPVLYVQLDGTGVPVVKKETVGRRGKTRPNRPTRGRPNWEACSRRRLGSKKGTRYAIPTRPPTSPPLSTAEEFGKRLYPEAWKRGWSRAAKRVVIDDGAEWIWNIANEHFPDGIQVVDLFHARQHLWGLARKRYPNQDAEQKAWMTIHQDLLDEGKIEDLVAALRPLDSSHLELAEKTRTDADYFDKNAKRMRYPESKRAAKPSSVPLQAVWNVLDGTRGKRHPGSAMLPNQRPL